MSRKFPVRKKQTQAQRVTLTYITEPFIFDHNEAEERRREMEAEYYGDQSERGDLRDEIKMASAS